MYYASPKVYLTENPWKKSRPALNPSFSLSLSLSFDILLVLLRDRPFSPGLVCFAWPNFLPTVPLSVCTCSVNAKLHPGGFILTSLGCDMHWFLHIHMHNIPLVAFPFRMPSVCLITDLLQRPFLLPLLLSLTSSSLPSRLPRR